MSCGSASKFSEVRYRRVGLWVDYPYPIKWIVSFSISIITTKFWDSNYSEYQLYLFNKIRGLKEDILTPIGYRKISNILNDEGLLTVRNTPFTNSKVFSIYQKGLKREERINRKDIVEVKNLRIEPFDSHKY